MFSRNHQTPYVKSVRPLTRDDLLALRDRSAAAGRLKRLRDSHLNICRLAALGLSTSEIANRTGYTPTRISQLLNNNPAMQDQIARFRETVDESWREQIGEYSVLGTRNMIRAEQLIAERLDDGDDEPLPIRELIAIARDGADRFGYGKKTTNLNINVDFAARLEAARRRSARVIEGASDAA